MKTSPDLLYAVLDAAERVLSAREDRMLTSEEWDALEHAVAACREPPPSERQETFAAEHGSLVRRVIPKKGEPYEHRCSQEVFEAVAHAIEEMGSEPFTCEDIRNKEQQPWTQVAVAVAFLKERGLLEPVHGRRHTAVSGYTFEDAMVEYHALREQPT